MKRMITLLCIAALPALVNAQAPNKPAPVTPQEKTEAVTAINKLLKDDYIYPQVADKMVAALSANLKKGNYNAISDPFQLADKLTADLIAISNDKHFIVQVDPDWVADSKRVVSKQDSLAFVNRDIAEFKKDNFGFKDVKVLDGNIGYLNLIGFCPTSYAGETAVAAMGFLSNTDAIIIDLRGNGGGSSQMVQLLASYFLSESEQPLVEFYTRKGNEREQDFALPYLPGKRLTDKDLYILTSHGTFSAAESFTYIMKNRKRATIVGETTGGGAHPVDREAVNDRFTIRIPISLSTDPITKTDWEGTGIAPDVEVPQNDDAIVTAQIKAIEKLAAATADNKDYLWQLDGLKGRQHPAVVDAEILKTYAGKYGQRNIIFEDGSLYFQKAGGERHKMIPIAQDVFLVDGIDDVKIKIAVENGHATELDRLYADGDVRSDKRDE